MWPQTSLTPESFEIAAHLAARMNDFGRAKSLVCARTERDLDWQPRINTRLDGAADAGIVEVDVWHR